MEHEVFVPVPGERLRAVLADPARVARAVPGLQQDAAGDTSRADGAGAGAPPVTGRLKLRVGGRTITYRGTLRVTARDDGSYGIDGEAAEVRGSGTVTLAVTLRPADAEGGTVLAFDATATADGRAADLPAQDVTAAVARLLDRFAEGLGEQAGPGPEEDGPDRAADSGQPDPAQAESPELLASGEFETAATTDFETTPDADDPPAPGAERPSVFDTEVPPPSLDPLADGDEDAAEGADDEDAAGGGDGDEDAAEGADGDEDADAAAEPEPAGDGKPVAEAAHARRTMIGRSAEEVDHAPPRGRYAPVPAPQTVSPASALRWAVPAAAAVVASAVVVGRVLRRRR
jgi:carbon monoxide dehydrogenase subunit G